MVLSEDIFSVREHVVDISSENLKAEELFLRYPPPSYFLGVINGAMCADKESALRDIAKAMNFPAYFGGNFDALSDCLVSLGEFIPGRKNMAIVLENSAQFLSASPEDRLLFEEILAEASEFLIDKSGIRLKLIKL